MSYTSIKNPELGTCIRKPEALNATCHSAAINADDNYLDPVNYWLGMWGKLIVLAAIKRQADYQQVDPEADIQNLDWDSIRQEILQRTPQKLNGILGGSACYNWFQNRVLAYEKQFPDYKLHNKSVIQQLFQHYAHHMIALQESGSVSANNLYWEHWYKQPSSGVLSINESPTQEVRLVSPVQELVEAKVKVDERELNKNGNDPCNHPEHAIKIEESVELVPGKSFVESNSKTCSLKSNAVGRKRTPPEVNKTVVETEIKRRKIDEQERKKAYLLSVLWTFKFGHGLIYEISQEVTRLEKLQGEAWSCEHTLDRIEEKIINLEITDPNVLMSSIRCLVALHLSLTSERKLTKKVSQTLDMLRKSTVIDSTLAITNSASHEDSKFSR